MSDASVQDESLRTLVRAASETTAGVERMAAVGRLRTRRLGQREAHLLCEMAQKSPQPAWRAAAAQVLGHHRAAAAFPEIQDLLADHAQKEPDLVAQKALAFALRDTEAALSLLNLRHPTAAVEAVLFSPSTDAGWDAVLERFFGEEDGQVDAAILSRIGSEPGGAARALVYLLESDFPETCNHLEERVSLLLGVLDQGAVFEVLAEDGDPIRRTYGEIWSGIRRRERRRALVGIFEGLVRQNGFEEGLAEALVVRTASEEGFLDRNLRFVKALLVSLDGLSSRRVLDLATCIPEGPREEAARLARFLVVLSGAVPDVAVEIQELLGRWEALLPGVGLKAYHARLGTA